MHPGGVELKQGLFYFIQTAFLIGCNSVLYGFQEYYVMPDVIVIFLKKEGSSHLNGLFLPTELRRIREGKDYPILDMIFLFVCGYVEIWTGYDDEATLTKVRTQYLDLINYL